MRVFGSGPNDDGEPGLKLSISESETGGIPGDIPQHHLTGAPDPYGSVTGAPDPYSSVTEGKSHYAPSRSSTSSSIYGHHRTPRDRMPSSDSRGTNM